MSHVMRTSESRVKKIMAVAAAALLCFGLAACDSDDGPMEKAGRSVDQAASDVGNKIDETATDVGNKVEDTCEQAKDAAGMKDTDC